ncbi:hypothetical protein [Nonomuraea endophytica]|uniref:Uncharacterized protein n=1 Tax=Nonomuraea endophytica TaxID=714136 RepID=A0A7W8A3E4_9ACTN|nr:hypothetical protein [Nonomuraea endophytica]MBB5078229.1 hypothetical protein [Nonomuraea endophytica]
MAHLGFDPLAPGPFHEVRTPTRRPPDTLRGRPEDRDRDIGLLVGVVTWWDAAL